jgi:hypothetical protein
VAEATEMQWRGCIGFADYEVSECGDVRRATASKTRRKGWRLRGFIDGDGYIRYALIDSQDVKQPARAHRLVAEAFLGPPPSALHEVAHNNGSRVWNHVSNLRWATRQENQDDTIVHGTTQAGCQNGNSKLSDQDVRDIRKIYSEIKNRQRRGKISDVARSYGIHHATLINIAVGRTWTHIS